MWHFVEVVYSSKLPNSFFFRPYNRPSSKAEKAGNSYIDELPAFSADQTEISAAHQHTCLRFTAPCPA